MSAPPERTPERDAWIALVMLVSVIAPTALVLWAASPDPATARCGYTWSLLLFAGPIAAIAWWFVRDHHYRVERWSFLWTLAVLLPLGGILDFVFAHGFLVFDNPATTIGLPIPTLQGGSVPVEEYAFYALGFCFVLLLYIWCDEYWLAAYHRDDGAEQRMPLVRFHGWSLTVGVLVIGIGMAIRLWWSGLPPGFPAYLAYLVAASVVPSVGLFASVRARVNWPAFAFTAVVTLLISVAWEVTLAMPGRWWGYESTAMVGVFVGPWGCLPAEAALVWVAVSYTTVIVYETVKAARKSPRSVGAALFGDRAG